MPCTTTTGGTPSRRRPRIRGRIRPSATSVYRSSISRGSRGGGGTGTICHFSLGACPARSAVCGDHPCPRAQPHSLNPHQPPRTPRHRADVVVTALRENGVEVTVVRDVDQHIPPECGDGSRRG